VATSEHGGYIRCHGRFVSLSWARYWPWKLVELSVHLVGIKRMSRVIKMSTPKGKPAGPPKTAALAKAQADHKAWLKARGIKATKNTLRT
jgi:hypothetical protein